MSLTIRFQPQVTFLLPGSFFPETLTRNVESHDARPDDIPANAFAYEFSIRRFVKNDITGEEFEGERERVPGRTYIGGKIMSADELPEGTLKFNCKANRWAHVIQCRTGNWQPFTEQDHYIEAPR